MLAGFSPLLWGTEQAEDTTASDSAVPVTDQPVKVQQPDAFPNLLTPIPKLPNTQKSPLPSTPDEEDNTVHVTALEEMDVPVNPERGSLAALFLESYPVGATVYLDGKKVGVTPYQHLDLKADQVLELRLSHLLYHDSVWSLTLKSGSNEPEVVHLSPAFGRLSVTTKPYGASVWLDGEQVGITPYSRDHVASGRHRLLLRKKWYTVIEEQEIEVKDGETTEMTVDLQPNFGTLSVDVDPPGALVSVEVDALPPQETIDSAAKPSKITFITPANKRLSAGDYVITVSQEGYKSKRYRLSMLAGKIVVIDKTRLRQLTGLLLVSSEPFEKGAKVLVDGQEKGRVPVMLELGEGSHRIEVIGAEGQGSRVVQVDEGSEASLAIRLLSAEALAQVIPDEAEAMPALRIMPQHAANVSVTRHRAGEVAVFADMQFIWVPSGCFWMGNDHADSDESPTHKACFKQGFWMGQTEVTQTQWESLMGSNPSAFQRCGSNCPVESVSWHAVQALLENLNTQGQGIFKLPTEAQWEYACRDGGRKQAYCGGDSLQKMAWYKDNAEGKTHPVAEKQPNGLGLYDMNGNVGEWISEWYAPYALKTQDSDQAITESPSFRVRRGGSWRNEEKLMRSTYRSYFPPALSSYNLGIRLIRLP